MPPAKGQRRDAGASEPSAFAAELAGREPPESLGYERAIEELEALIEAIESGAIGLEDAIAAYERGAKLLARCRGILDTAEQRISSIDLGDAEAAAARAAGSDPTMGDEAPGDGADHDEAPF